MKIKGIPKKKLYSAMAAVCCFIILIACAVLIFGVIKREHAKKLFNDMQNEIIVLNEPQAPEETVPLDTTEDITADTAAKTQEAAPKEFSLPDGYEIPYFDIDFEQLRESQSPDIYAWLYVPNTNINYPIVQNAKDDSYYLNYNLDGSKGLPGGIYTEKLNSKEFDDPLTVIYGHNMKDKSMFGSLHKFEEPAFFNENPYFFIYTPDKVLVYEIFAANKYDNSHLLLSVNSKEPTALQAYLNYTFTLSGTGTNMKDKAKRIAPLDEPDETRKIVALSTCTGDSGTRYLVQGVLLNGQDDN